MPAAAQNLDTVSAPSVAERVAAARSWLGEFLADAEDVVRFALQPAEGDWEEMRRFATGFGSFQTADQDVMLDSIAAYAVKLADQGNDVFATPYSHDGPRRAGGATSRRHVHCDVDGALDLDKVKALGGMAVASGSVDAAGQPHGHVYLRLSEDVPAHLHTALCRALGKTIGGDLADESKIRDNDVLRPAGTVNHKHGQARSVSWLISPDDPSVNTWSPDALAHLLGIAWPPPEPVAEVVGTSERAVDESGAHQGTPAAVASPWLAAAVSGELDDLRALPRPWVEGSSGWDPGMVKAARRLVELANALDDLDGVREQFMAAAPFDEWDRRAEKWAAAVKHVGERSAKVPAPCSVAVSDDRSTTTESDSTVTEDGATARADAHALKVAGMVDTLRAQREARSIVATEDAPEPPEVRELGQWLAEPDEPVRWLVRDVWPAGERVLWVGPAKSGKTTGRDNVVRSLVDGVPFLGRHEVEAVTEGVALLDFELGEKMLRRWLRLQNIEHPERVDVYPMRGRGSAFNVLAAEVRSMWAARLKERGRRVLVVDCLRPLCDALGLDENRELSKILNALDALIAEAGMTEWIALHHTGRQGEHSRGDSGADGTAGVLWRTVREDPDRIDSPRYFSAFGRDVSLAESLLSFDEASHALTIGGGSRAEVRADAASDQVLAVLPVAGHGEALSGRQVETAVGGAAGRDAVRRSLRDLVESGVVVTSKGPRNSRLHALAAKPSETSSARVRGSAR